MGIFAYGVNARCAVLHGERLWPAFYAEMFPTRVRGLTGLALGPRLASQFLEAWRPPAMSLAGADLHNAVLARRVHGRHVCARGVGCLTAREEVPGWSWMHNPNNIFCL